MDSTTEFDDDEDFFGSYDAEPSAVAARVSQAQFEFEEEAPLTPQQRAHLTRFRKPVALVVAGMALLSVVALGAHGSQQHSQDELVAHYGAALPAPAPSAASATLAQTALMPSASSGFVPEALSALIAEVWSTFMPEASSTANAAVPALGVSAPGAALEPALPDTALAEFFNRPEPGLIKPFISAPSPLCLRPAESDTTPGGQSDAANSPQLPNTGHSISEPVTIAVARPALSTPARSALSAPAKPALSAPARTVPFSSVARFPDAHR